MMPRRTRPRLRLASFLAVPLIASGFAGTSATAAETGENPGGVGAEAPAMADGGSLARAVPNRVRIGGRAQVAEYYGRYHKGPLSVSPADFDDSGSDRVNNSQFQARKAEILFRIDASETAALHIGLDLTRRSPADRRAYPHAPRDRDENLLDHAYFELREVGNPGLSLRIGQQAMPFGMHKDELLISPWIVDRPERLDGFDDWFGQGAGFAHQTPGAIERVFGVVSEQKFLRDLASVEVGLFQHREGRHAHNRHTADDFGSVAARAIFEPLEGGGLYASFANIHNAAGDDRPGGVANQQWFSVGLELKPSIFWFTIPFDFFAEYQWARQNDFLDGGASRNLHAGVAWYINTRWRLNLQGEWLRTRSEHLPPAGLAAAEKNRRQNDLHRMLWAMEYDLAELFTLECGWQREWLRARGEPLTADGRARWSGRGDLWYAGIKLEF